MTSMPDSTRIRSNSLWMMADQVFRQSLGLLFSIWIARQYGPEGFGTLSFALRAPDNDKTYETEPVDVDYLINRYDLPIEVGK